ncbi:hypothetical protein ACFXP3_19765 [Streptomyces sp. NPDC059096]|uniref:hypothetical protein n=1 Tax=Streptomyces sp. NPDC059096 TaxID=3346727 RepID=UPI0036813B48
MTEVPPGAVLVMGEALIDLVPVTDGPETYRAPCGAAPAPRRGGGGRRGGATASPV